MRWPLRRAVAMARYAEARERDEFGRFVGGIRAAVWADNDAVSKLLKAP